MTVFLSPLLGNGALLALRLVDSRVYAFVLFNVCRGGRFGCSTLSAEGGEEGPGAGFLKPFFFLFTFSPVGNETRVEGCVSHRAQGRATLWHLSRGL